MNQPDPKAYYCLGLEPGLLTQWAEPEPARPIDISHVIKCTGNTKFQRQFITMFLTYVYGPGFDRSDIMCLTGPLIFSCGLLKSASRVTRPRAQETRSGAVPTPKGAQPKSAALDAQPVDPPNQPLL